MAQLVAGADAVLSCLGARTSTDIGIAQQATRTILAGMQQADVTRLVVISAAPVAGMTIGGLEDTGDDALTRLVLAPLLRRVYRRNYEDLAEMEGLVQSSAAAWTIVRPPRLTDGPLTGHYRTRLGRNLPRARSISRYDLADLLIRLPAMSGTIRQSVAAAY